MILKKMVTVLLALGMLVPDYSVSAEVLDTEQETILEEKDSEDYEVGDKLQGFILKEEKEIENLSAALRLWEHEKTGAQAYFIHNDDQDRTFSIAFRTEPSDDTGKLHILEHAVCAASENYPGQDVFFDAVSQAYITDINAATYKSATNYYVSSMSEDQLERMADFYLDCAFNSALRSEPNYYYREGWRYTMADEEAPLTVDGIVYNEMKGIYGDIYSVHYSQSVERALFPDTYQRWDSGGYPPEITDLTYEELIAFYDECYHPSNSISMVYGDVETERYLRLMDGYFSLYEAQDSAGYSPGQKPFEQMVTYQQFFPVSADSEQTGSVLSYAVVLPEGVGFEEINALSMGQKYLSDLSSPLMEALYASGIGSDYYAEGYLCGTQYCMLFTADEADAARAEEFKDIITESLSTMIEDGFDQEVLDSIFAKNELSNALISNEEGLGITMASVFAQVVDSGYVELLDKSAGMEAAQALCRDGGLETLLEKYVLENTHAALILTTPKAGLLEEQEAAETKRLADIKASMSQEELEQIIADTKAFNQWSTENGSVPETLSKLRTENPDTVQAEIPVYETAVLDVDGATLYTADVEGEAAYCEYIFDISHLTADEIRVLDVYANLLGLSTEKRDQREISIAMSSLLSDFEISTGVETRADGSVYPALFISFYAMNENVKDAAELVMEMFAHTALTDNTGYFDSVISGKMQDYYDAETVAKGIAHDAALSGSSAAAALRYVLFGMDYYTWLSELREKDPGEVTELFAAVREKALVREGTDVLSVGNVVGKEERSEILCALLPEKTLQQEKQDWTEVLEKTVNKTTAFKGNGTSSYVVSGMYITPEEHEAAGELKLLLALMEDTYLIPEFRFQMGAYNTNASLNDQGRYRFRLYRAPSYAEALSRLPELPGEMEILLADMTAEELEGYQLSIVSETTMPTGIWNEAVDQINYQRLGISTEARQVVLDQVCDASPESLMEALPELEEIINSAGTAVVAPGTVIEEHKELFDKVEVLP